MGDITKLYPKGSAKDPDAVLEQANGEYTDLLIVGWDKDESLQARGTSGLSANEVLWLIEVFKNALITGAYSSE